MSVDRNRAMARRFFEDGWNRRDYAVFDEVLAPNWVYYGYSATPAGMGGLKERLAPLFQQRPLPARQRPLSCCAQKQRWNAEKPIA